MAFATPKRLQTNHLTVAHRHAPQHEKATAKKVGGKVTPGSGSKFYEKGDVRVKGKLRMELKCTTRKSFAVTRDMLTKIEVAARAASPREIPALEIQFLDEIGAIQETVAVVPTWVLLEVLKVER